MARDIRSFQRVRGRAIAIGIVLTLVVAACTGQAIRMSELSSSEKSQPPLENGVDLFRGLVFGEGEVGRIVADVMGAMPERTGTGIPLAGDLATIRETLVVRFQSADPGFFDAFGEDMQSGDRIRVARAIERSSVLLGNVTGNREASPAGLGLGTMAIMHVVLSYDAASMQMMVVAMDEANELPTWDPSTMSSLQRDQLVDRIATQLEHP